MPTHDELSTVVTELLNEHNHWLDNPGPWITAAGEVVNNPAESRVPAFETVSQRLTDLMDHLVDFLRSADFEERDWPAVLSLDALAEVWLNWLAEFEIGDGKPLPPPQKWALLERAYRQLEKPPRQPMEPPHVLADPNLKPPVSVEQIAKMYGWRNSLGNPDVTKVAQELNRHAAGEPYEHYSPDMPHPGDIQEREAMQAEWNGRLRRMAADIDEREAEQKAAESEGPETLDELILTPGMSLQQILRMKRTSIKAGDLTQEDVVKRAEELDVFLPNVPLDAAKFANTPGDFQKQALERVSAMAEAQNAEALATTQSTPVAQESAEDDPETVIADGTLAGLKPGEIAQQLGGKAAGWTPQKVGKVIKKLRAEV